MNFNFGFKVQNPIFFMMAISALDLVFWYWLEWQDYPVIGMVLPIFICLWLSALVVPSMRAYKMNRIQVPSELVVGKSYFLRSKIRRSPMVASTLMPNDKAEPYFENNIWVSQSLEKWEIWGPIQEPEL
jgi:hypothetical protein